MYPVNSTVSLVDCVTGLLVAGPFLTYLHCDSPGVHPENPNGGTAILSSVVSSTYCTERISGELQLGRIRRYYGDLRSPSI